MFTTKEQEIIKYGLANGKTKQQVEQALTNLRLGITPQKVEAEPEKEQGSMSRAFEGGINQAKEGYVEAINAKNPLELFEKSIKSAAGVVGAAFSPLAPIVEPTIGKVVGKAGEILADAPLIQGAAGNQVVNQDGTIKFEPNFGADRTVENISNLNTVVGAVAGGAKAAPKITGALKATTESVSNAFDFVKANAAKYPKEISNKITMGKINLQTQTILKEVPVEKFDRYVKSGVEAMRDPRALTPLEQAGETANNLLSTIKEDMGRIGKQKSASLKSVKDIKVSEVASSQIPKVEAMLRGKLTTAERALVNEYLNELKALGKNPTAGSVDATIDKLQATLYEKSKGVSIPTTTRVKSFINSSIRDLNEQLKSTVDKKLGGTEYSTLNKAYKDRIEVYQTLNKMMGEDGTRGGSLLKRFFSPQNGGVKLLFKDIKEIYGVDLAQDATIAKFVMDTLGDTRARSLLQLPATTPVGAAAEILKRIEEKLTTPKKVIEKARTLTSPQETL